MFSLRFPESEIEQWAERYAYQEDTLLQETIGPAMRSQGFLTKAQFLELAHWKSPRTQPRCARNSDSFVIAVTRTAMETADEQLRVEVLRLLNGVCWPTASVILHFGHPEPYPILDFRALWSLGYDAVPQYDYAFWDVYVDYCRTLAGRMNLSMRMIDRALWQYSKEHQ